MAKKRVPLNHSHTIINNEIIYKIDNKIINKAYVNSINYDDKIEGVYRFKNKPNLHFTFFKTSKKFNISIVGSSTKDQYHKIRRGREIWGTCEIVKLSTHKEEFIASKPETKNLSNSTEQFEQEKQNV